MKARIADFARDMATGRQRLTLELDGDFRDRYDALRDKDLELELKVYRRRRSLSANAYCWELIGKLAEALNLPAVEIYRDAIKRVGIWRDFEGLTEQEAKTLRAAWGQLGIGWLSEQVDYHQDGDRVTVRCYYGSSRYNVRQMSRLINDIAGDCEALGIETRPPCEVDRLLSLWEQEAKKQQ